jgi:hypothetical protein
MCQISESLKLCTCDKEELESSKNTWVLSRAKPEADREDDVIVGLYLPPRALHSQTEEINVLKLGQMINSGSCFDTPITIRDGDELTFYIESSKQRDEQLIYCFRFFHHIWLNVPFYPFGSRRNVEAEGCLK